MSEHIPAWKRIGLKVQEELATDPLALSAHLDSGDLTRKQQKKLTKRTRSNTDKEKDGKAPKRQKVPKSERPPPPEKDQLVYLKTYTTDKDNWKFSKQKQNWILKHVKVIEETHEEYLINYFSGLQGGGKDRMAALLRDVCTKWNELQNEQPVEKADDDKKEGDEQQRFKPQKKDLHDELTSVDADYAIRAKKLLKAMTGEEATLKGIDDAEKEEAKEEAKSDSITSDNDSASSSEAGSDSESDSESAAESSGSSPLEATSKSEAHDNLIIEEVEVSNFVSDADFEFKKSKKSKKTKQTSV